MEAADGDGPHRLTPFAQLLAAPEQHHIFQALRIIEATYQDRPRFGESRRPREDAFRLEQDPELAFPPSTITRVEAPSDGKPGRLSNYFFGLWGPMGPLPIHMTEYARDRLRNHRDPTLVAFANMLTHRLFGLLYRAWAAAQPAPSFDRALRGNLGRSPADPFERKVASLSGHFEAGTRDRDAMPDLAKRHFLAHLAPAPRHPEGLVNMISAFVNAPVALQEFVGEWLDLEPDDRWQLGAAAGLGRATSIGTRVWSTAAKFRLRIGPMGLADFRRLMPGTTGLKRVEAIVRNYVGDAFDWDINLVLARDEVPQAQLGGDTPLGHTSWIGRRTGDSDADDLYLVPQGLTARRRAA
jgi:type VI secretion system protein ImpH